MTYLEPEFSVPYLTISLIAELGVAAHVLSYDSLVPCFTRVLDGNWRWESQAGFKSGNSLYVLAWQLHPTLE